MKILHTADWHLGKLVYGVSMLEEQKYFLEETLFPAIEREQPDCLVLAGDIFDRNIAPPQAIRLFDAFILKLHSTYGLPLLAITGNHDGQDRITLAAELLRDKGIYISTKISDAFSPVVLTKNGAAYHFYLLPYFEPAQLRAELQNEGIKGFADAYRAAAGHIAQGFEENAVNILVSHCFVTGCTVSDSESPLYVGGSGEISADAFSPFDLTLLGHLHAPQQAGKNAYYSGSPLKYSFDEEHQKKSLSVIELDCGKTAVRRIPIKARHDMKTIRGSFSSLCEQGKKKQDTDYIFASLTDDHPIYMPVDRLREFYPNLLGLKSEFLSRTGSENNCTIKRTSTDDEIFTQFITQICSSEVTESDRALFHSAMDEVREADR